MKIDFKLTLEAARKNAGYTQEEAAKAIGVHYQTIAAWEKDGSALSVRESNELAKLYHVPADILFFGNKNEFIRNLRNKEFV